MKKGSEKIGAPFQTSGPTTGSRSEPVRAFGFLLILQEKLRRLTQKRRRPIFHHFLKIDCHNLLLVKIVCRLNIEQYNYSANFANKESFCVFFVLYRCFGANYLRFGRVGDCFFHNDFHKTRLYNYSCIFILTNIYMCGIVSYIDNYRYEVIYERIRNCRNLQGSGR